ncbi:MAG: hypothetical protein IKR73_00345 [Oscillospiraceae bacterium]|nr:hypothetical protein [Oscillospiraceae bacterium]
MVWKDLSEFPTDTILDVQRRITDYNKQTRGAYIFIAVTTLIISAICFSRTERPLIPVLAMNAGLDLLWVIIYNITKMDTDMMKIKACEDYVISYTKARRGRYYRPPFVTTDSGIRAYIYDNMIYGRGDRIIAVKGGRTGQNTFCIPCDTAPSDTADKRYRNDF